MIVGFISCVQKFWIWVFHGVTSSSAHNSSQSPFQDRWDLKTVCKFKNICDFFVSFPVFMWKESIILQIIYPDNHTLHYSVRHHLHVRLFCTNQSAVGPTDVIFSEQRNCDVLLPDVYHGDRRNMSV